MGQRWFGAARNRTTREHRDGTLVALGRNRARGELLWRRAPPPARGGSETPSPAVAGVADLRRVEPGREDRRLRKSGLLGALLAAGLRPRLGNERLPLQAEGPRLGQRIQAARDVWRRDRHHLGFP